MMVRAQHSARVAGDDELNISRQGLVGSTTIRRVILSFAFVEQLLAVFIRLITYLVFSLMLG